MNRFLAPLFLVVLCALPARAQDFPAPQRSGNTLPLFCSNTRVTFNLLVTDGANAPGLYRCNGSAFVPVGSSFSFSSPTTNRLAKFASSTSLSNSLLSDDATNVSLVSGQLLLPDGTASLPSLTLANSTGVGFYNQGSGRWAYTSGGTARVLFNQTSSRLELAGWGLTFGSAVGSPTSGLAQASAGIVKVTDGSTGTGRLMTIGVRSGTASNTDLDGQLTLSGGTASYTFAGTYASPPICIATNTSAATALQVTATTTTLTVTGSGTDVVNYICHGRN
jgi:hypothetical protein